LVRRCVGSGSRWALVLVTAIVLALSVAACGSDDEGGDAGAAKDEPIVIGVTDDLSGPLSPLEIPILNGIKLAVADQNAKGGVLGRKLKVVSNDNQNDLDLIEPKAKEILEQGIDFMMPTCSYDQGAPAARLANAEGIIAISCPGSPLFGAEGVGPLTYNSDQATPTEAAVLASLAADHGIEKPYLLLDTSIQYDKDLCTYFEKTWKALDASNTIAGQDTFLNSDQSVASQVNRVKASGADAVVLCSYPPGGVTALRQLRGKGVDVPVYTSFGFDGTYWTEAVPDVSDVYYNAVASFLGDDPDPEVNAMYERYREMTGEEPTNSYPVFGYSQVQALVRAMERAESTDGEKVAAELNKFKDEPLLAGPTTYTEDCHVPLGRPTRVMEFQDGKLSFVELVEPKHVPESPC
jgi:branched-chain amino acid transport system substrate-binding protein